MAWSINFVGSKNGVKREIQAAIPIIDPVQLPVVRSFIIAAIDALPTSTKGVQISARGHRDELTYRLEMEVQPLALVLDEP